MHNSWGFFKYRFLTSSFQHCKPAERTIVLDANVGTFTKQSFTEEQSLLKKYAKPNKNKAQGLYKICKISCKQI